MPNKIIFTFCALLTMTGAAAFGAQNQSVEEYLQSLSTVTDVTTRRDPFALAPSPFHVHVAPAEPTGIDPNAPILQRFPTKDYTVVAVLLGDIYPRALVKPPNGNGGVLIVKENDKLGNRGGIISRINQDSITVLQKKRMSLATWKKLNLFLRVGAKAGDVPAGTPGGTQNGAH